MTIARLPLVGAGGESVDFARTIVSPGVAKLMPNSVDLQARALETTLPVPGGARTVRITEAARALNVEAVAGRGSAKAGEALAATIAHMFRLDEDLSEFYAVACEDGELAWCAHGAGRMLSTTLERNRYAEASSTSLIAAINGRRHGGAPLVLDVGSAPWSAAPAGATTTPTHGSATRVARGLVLSRAMPRRGRW